MARPVDEQFSISQLFAGLATRGVVGRPNGSEVEYLVWLYGDYQPYGHAGVDIACPVGTPVRAMNAGTVVYAGWGEDLPGDDSWGPSGYFRRWGMYKTFPGIVTVIKQRGANKFDIYGHQSDNEAVKVGMTVEEGQVIGLSGDTKTRTEKVGPHLHVVTVADPVSYSTDWPRLIFGCEDPTPYFGNIGLVLQGAITNAATTQAQEDEMSAAAEAQIARIHQILEAQESDRIRERIIAIDDRTAVAGSKYLKGDQDATLYEFDGGKLRGINLVEWQATGQGYRTLPQDIINALPKEA
jgi:hypothetical protein